MKKELVTSLLGLGLIFLPLYSHAANRVTVKTFSELAVFPEVSLPATAESMNDSKLSAEVKGKIKGIPVLVGDTVERGEMILEQDSRDYVLALRSAEAALEGINARVSLAAYQMDQAQRLSAEDAVTVQVLRQREAELQGIQAERDMQIVAVEMAKRDLEKCTIRAPFTAVIVERYAQVGELANPGSPLVRVVDVSRIEVSVKVQSQDVPAMEAADQFFFKVDDDVYPLILRQITPALDPVQRNREARFLFKQAKALSGTAGTLYWKNPKPHIPSNLLVSRKGQLGVFTLQGNVAKFVHLIEAREGRPVAADLKKDTRIIVDGRFTLQDGDEVTLAE